MSLHFQTFLGRWISWRYTRDIWDTEWETAVSSLQDPPLSSHVPAVHCRPLVSSQHQTSEYRGELEDRDPVSRDAWAGEARRSELRVRAGGGEDDWEEVRDSQHEEPGHPHPHRQGHREEAEGNEKGNLEICVRDLIWSECKFSPKFPSWSVLCSRLRRGGGHWEPPPWRGWPRRRGGRGRWGPRRPVCLPSVLRPTETSTVHSSEIRQ